MKRILYIGENQNLYTRLAQSKEIEVEKVANVVGFHNALGKLDRFDFIISDARLKGLDGVGIFARFKDQINQFGIPFGIIIKHPEKTVRLALLKEGVSEIFSPDTEEAVMIKRIDFLKEMLKSRLTVAKTQKFKEYQIPISKRIFDIIVAGCALIIFSPLIILSAIAIKLESKGPIWYISKRVGTGYKVFDFYKLRSMYVDADKRVADMKHMNQYAVEAENAKKQIPGNKIPKNSPNVNL